MRNVSGDFTFDSEISILICGGGTAFDLVQGDIKRYSPRIFTAEPGATSVRLKNKAEAINIRPGRWHLVGSYDQQVGGYPPNIRYFDYVRVTAVSGESVILDRRLQHLHREDFFEKPSDPNSFGAARIIPMDLGGLHGLIPSSDARLTIRQTFKDIEFVTNSINRERIEQSHLYYGRVGRELRELHYAASGSTVVEHLRYLGGFIDDSEPDKLIATLIAGGVRSGETGGATGIELYFMRDLTSAPMQISPPQFRAINSTIDATNDRYLWYPITWAYNGPVLSVELQGTSLRINPTNSDTRVMPSIKHLELILGRDGSWSGERLIISSNSPMFLDWQVWLFEGMIVYGEFGSWGIVRRLSSAPDGSAVWADIQWMAGVKPTGGQLQAGRGHCLTIDGKSKLDGGDAWGATCGGFMRQTLPSDFGAGSYDFPTGYPASEYGF